MQSTSDLDHTLAANLERIVADHAFKTLSEELNRFTPFKVLRVERYELRHTNTLAWLLDPGASHGMGHAFLDAFLQQILGPDAPLASPQVEVRTELVLHANDLVEDDDRSDDDEVNTQDRLDILVEGRAADGRPWAVAIEAKIDSQEGDAQLQRYDGALQRFLPRVEVAKCYLTLAPARTVSSTHWKQIVWQRHVGDVLQTVLAGQPGIDRRVHDFLVDYRGLIQVLSGEEDGQASQATRLANRSDVAPALRVLNERIKGKRAVHGWDAEPWAATYCRHKRALDACRNVVREAGAVLVWEVMDQHLADAARWQRITTETNRTLTVRFVPNSWAKVDGIRTEDGRWNLFYHAEFRRRQGDIEIKLYVAPPGDPAMQKALMERLFGSALTLRPGDLLQPAPKYLKDFVWGTGRTVKLYTQAIGWEERQDGTLSMDDRFDRAMKQFEDAVARHTAALLGLGKSSPAV